MWSHVWFDTYYHRYPCQKGQTIPPSTCPNVGEHQNSRLGSAIKKLIWFSVRPKIQNMRIRCEGPETLILDALFLGGERCSAHSGSHVSDAKEDWWQKLLSIPAFKHLLIQNPIKKTWFKRLILKTIGMSLDSYGTSWHISWTWTMTSSLDLRPSFQAKGSQFTIVARVCIETILQDFGFDPLNNGHQDQREVTAGPWFILQIIIYIIYHIIYCCCYMLTWTWIMSWLHRR